MLKEIIIDHFFLSIFRNRNAGFLETLTLIYAALVSAIAPDFSHNQLRSQTLVKVGGDTLIECKPKMSPWGVVSWRKGSEPLRESNR